MNRRITLTCCGVSGSSLSVPLPGAVAEIINHAADLSAASSVLTHENERRWRIFRERIEQITPPADNPDPASPS